MQLCKGSILGCSSHTCNCSAGRRSRIEWTWQIRYGPLSLLPQVGTTKVQVFSAASLALADGSRMPRKFGFKCRRSSRSRPSTTRRILLSPSQSMKRFWMRWLDRTTPMCQTTCPMRVTRSLDSSFFRLGTLKEKSVTHCESCPKAAASASC